MLDELPVSDGYEGVVAQAYDAWLPIDETWPDEPVYRDALRDVEGPILELGCGTGRPLLRWLADGLDVQGLDASADMLAILRGHAAERGLDPVLHHANFATLELDQRFGAIVCLVGTFLLVADEQRARDALASYAEHLRPGGLLGLTLGSAPPSDRDLSFVWRLRRTGTGADGTTYIVHEALHTDDRDGLTTVYDRLETYDPTGKLADTWMRRHRLRTWERPEIESALRDAGFEDVRSVGDDVGWVTLATRASPVASKA
jgi:SAM-dependent methyltransferase